VVLENGHGIGRGGFWAKKVKIFRNLQNGDGNPKGGPFGWRKSADLDRIEPNPSCDSLAIRSCGSLASQEELLFVAGGLGAQEHSG